MVLAFVYCWSLVWAWFYCLAHERSVLRPKSAVHLLYGGLGRNYWLELVWIFVDAFSVGLFWYKDLLPTVILFVVYTVMAYIGYREWKRELNVEQ